MNAPQILTMKPAHRYAAKPLRIVDADTLDLEIDLGLNVFVRERFRLAGLNAPERGTPGHAAALEYLQNEMQNAYLAGMVAETVKRANAEAREKYGRWLAWLYVANRSGSVNAEMVRLGLAVPMEY